MSRTAVAIGLFIGFVFIAFFVVSFMVFGEPRTKGTGLPGSPGAFTGRSIGTGISVDSVGSNTIAVRNTGNNIIYTSDIEIYIDDRMKSCFWNFDSIAPNSLAVCITDVKCDDELKVVAGGAQDAMRCPPNLPPPNFSMTGI